MSDPCDSLGLLDRKGLLMETMNIVRLTLAEKQANIDSHMMGRIDDCVRCVRCEIAVWNAWQRDCNG